MLQTPGLILKISSLFLSQFKKPAEYQTMILIEVLGVFQYWYMVVWEFRARPDVEAQIHASTILTTCIIMVPRNTNCYSEADEPLIQQSRQDHLQRPKFGPCKTQHMSCWFLEGSEREWAT